MPQRVAVTRAELHTLLSAVGIAVNRDIKVTDITMSSPMARANLATILIKVSAFAEGDYTLYFDMD